MLSFIFFSPEKGCILIFILWIFLLFSNLLLWHDVIVKAEPNLTEVRNKFCNNYQRCQLNYDTQ